VLAAAAILAVVTATDLIHSSGHSKARLNRSSDDSNGRSSPQQPQQ
jgi:hypothetical protein